MESFEDFGLKLAIRVVFMSTWRSMSARGQGHSLTLDSHSMTVINVSSKATKPIITYFIYSLQGLRKRKYVQTVQVTWSVWPQWLLQNLLQNQLTDGLETWYVALGTRELPWFFKWWPLVDIIIIIIGFFINVQVQGPYPQQWAPFQATGLLHAWQISHQISRYLYHEGR